MSPLLVERRGIVAQPTAPPIVFPSTGLYARLRADSIALADGAAVSSWNALVGPNPTNNGGNPAFAAASPINSQAAVKFNGEYWKWNGVSASQNPVSILAIFRMASLSASMVPIGTSDSGIGGMYMRIASSGQLQVMFYNGNTYLLTDSASPLAALTNYAVLLTFDDTSSDTSNNQFYVNGTAKPKTGTNYAHPGSFGSGTNTAIAADQWDSPPGFFLGWIAELAKWNKVLDATERAQLFAYTLARYGV